MPSKKNILIINGSPRPRGNISRLLECMKDEADKAGCRVTYVRTSALHIKPCTGCMQCRKDGRCRLPHDDSVEVLKAINECDVMVIGSPCYWGNIPGELKILFDRIVYGLMRTNGKGVPEPLQKGKQAVFISTCSTPFPFNILFKQSRGTIRALKEIFRWSGFRVVATFEKGGTKQHDVSEKDLARCRKIIGRLCR